MIVPTVGFNIFATANTKGKGSDDGRYIGTNILNEAFLERFAVTMVQEYPSSAVELKIITNVMNQFDCYDEDFAKDLVRWADTIRRTFDDGGIDENITTRRLIHIVKSFSIFNDKKKSVELCVNRFDESTRTSFIDLFDKIITEEPEVQIIIDEYEDLIKNVG
jgi:MoxR-like ATPase